MTRSSSSIRSTLQIVAVLDGLTFANCCDKPKGGPIGRPSAILAAWHARTKSARACWPIAGATEIEFLLAHPGGPYWARKDDGAWTIPKGLVRPDDLLDRRAPRIQRGDRIDRAGAVRAAAAGPAEERQDRAWLRLRRRFRPDEILQQHVRDGMAAALRPATGSSRRSTGSAGSVARAAMKKIIAYQRPFLVELQEKLAERLAPPTTPAWPASSARP